MWFLLLNLIPLMIWLERKGSAYIQDRIGPNRAHIGGLRLAGMVHNVADVVKLFTKEDIVPSHVSRGYYIAAPFVAMTVALMTYAVIPFADAVVIGKKSFPMQAANLSVGFLYILAIASLGVYAVVLSGWASNNKYGLLGGLRSSAQLISYEVSMGLSLIGLVMAFQTVELNDIVRGQGELLFGFLPKWGIVIQPLAFVLYLTCAFAETNRNPFDLPEGESEIVAGYHVEYSSMKFALFFMAEYVNILVQGAIVTTLFLGGWQVPWLPTAVLKRHLDVVLPLLAMGTTVILCLSFVILRRYDLANRTRWQDARRREGLWLSRLSLAGALAFLILSTVFVKWPVDSKGGWPSLVVGMDRALHLLPGGVRGAIEQLLYWKGWGGVFTALVQFSAFVTKLLLVAWLFIWVRWTLPRFRYDQLMKLGWQVMLPLALANLVVTGVVYFVQG